MDVAEAAAITAKAITKNFCKSTRSWSYGWVSPVCAISKRLWGWQTNHIQRCSQTMRVYEINPNLILFWNQTLRHYLYTAFCEKVLAAATLPFTLETIQKMKPVTDPCGNYRIIDVRSRSSAFDVNADVDVDRLRSTRLLQLHWWPALAAFRWFVLLASCYC